MLRRLPIAVSGVDLSWLDAASMLAAFRADGLNREDVIDAPVCGDRTVQSGGRGRGQPRDVGWAVGIRSGGGRVLAQARDGPTVMELKP